MISSRMNLIPVLVRKLVCRMPPLDPTTIDQDANVVTIRQNGFDESLDLVSMREIRSVDGSLPPERSNLIPCGGVAVVALYEHYIGSGFR
jgi:hypothetical protein